MQAQVYTIMSSTGEAFPCGVEESVLAAMRRANAGPIRYGCFGGGCGACKMRVVSGSYVVFKPMSCAHVSATEQLTGLALLCCIHPTSDLVLAEE
ncbi:MAG TPA: 2Fe-2S iron-sulfur cluster-binding protein [Clostridia bacterium]|nr:2Fe-2S iron-sulfur cluster-binding protein [Clostridia bacterium]